MQSNIKTLKQHTKNILCVRYAEFFLVTLQFGVVVFFYFDRKKIRNLHNTKTVDVKQHAEVGEGAKQPKKNQQRQTNLLKMIVWH